MTLAACRGSNDPGRDEFGELVGVLDEEFVGGHRIATHLLDGPDVDVIPVEMPEDMIMRANGVPAFKVKMGSHKGNLALQVIEPIERR